VGRPARSAVSWIVPTVGYVLAVGALGVTGKLALRDLSWPDLILWTGAGYICVATVLLALGRTQLQLVDGTPWAMLSGVIAISALIMLYVALGTGNAGTVSAISAAYPVVTLPLAAAFLSEALTVGRAVGAGLVVTGVVILTLDG
jgi:uncharacterized membrane protein